MKNFRLEPLAEEEIKQFKMDMQEAFQKGAEEGFEHIVDEILPESHIDCAMQMPGAITYKAVVDGKMVGGAIVVIDKETQHNHLHFLYVKNGIQGKGIGQAIWRAIEEKYSETKVWETCTPYFEKRNIHFYVNRCVFHIVEFFNKFHPDPNETEERDDLFDHEYFDGMLRFEKVMKPLVQVKS